MSSNKFEYYEVLKVLSDKKFLQEILHSKGTVLGMDKNDMGLWIYSVAIEEDSNLVWSIDEDDLQTTGQYKKRSDFYSDDTVKVVVDPETGEGSLKEED